MISRKKPNLKGKVALVAGATRGAGRGIAVALGEAGATVYCTGRSTRKQRATKGRPETIEETAVLVTAAGGKPITGPVFEMFAEGGDIFFIKVTGGRISFETGPDGRATRLIMHRVGREPSPAPRLS